MSLSYETYRRGARIALVLALVLLALPWLSNAQTAPAPKASSTSSEDTPKAELFVGYQWWNPDGNIPVTGTNPPTTFKLPSVAQGFGTNLSWNFTRNLALEGNYGGDWNRYASNSAATIGPKLTWRGDGVNFFVHTLLGFERFSSRGLDSTNGITAVLGGGMDLKIWKPLSLRLFEADYQLERVDFSHEVPPNEPKLARQTWDGARLTTGLVFYFGGGHELPVAAACSVQPTQVMVGEPVNATVVASNFNPKHTLTYTWASSGGTISGTGTGASINTTGIGGGVPGSYTTTVTATVTDAKATKNNTASCTANFTATIPQPPPPNHPPQMSCSASPSAVKAGGSSAINCSCTSPDNVAVTVSGWSASGGSISGGGSSATLSTTTNTPLGDITVGASCTDAHGLTASASTAVTVLANPQAAKLNECTYPNVKKPWRVDNTCKAALDDVALKLQQDPDAKLVVVGNADPKEKRKNLAAERAVDVKAYLSGGEAKQNIDASRIEARTGNEGTMASEQWIVPAGATFPEAGTTTPVDEMKVKAIPDHPKPAAKPAAKKAAKKAQ